MSHFQQALRQLVVRPGLAVAVIAMLAVGIGATTAVFSLFYQVLLEPLPVPEPERLVELNVPNPGPGGGGRASLVVDNTRGRAFAYSTFREFEASQTPFTGIAAHYDFIASLSKDTDTFGGSGTLVSGRYFEVLGVTPALGRLIGPQDEPGLDESAVAVLSYDYWQSRLGGDPNVLGTTVNVNDRALTVIGVAPEGFTGAMPGYRPHVYVPLTMRWQMQPDEPRKGFELSPFNTFVFLFARLRPDVTLEQATGAINTVFAGILQEHVLPAVPAEATDSQREQLLAQRVALMPAARGQNAPTVTASNPLALLLGATALVLLTVCVNITNLLLARGAARAGEMAIRAAIGAGRGRLAAQLFAEAAVFGVLGALLALPVAAATLRLIAAAAPAAIASRFTPELNAEALVIAAALLVVAVLFFGVWPALRASDTDAGHVMKGRSGQPGGGRALARFRAALIGVQVALSVLLLVLAGLFTRSLANVASVELGMDVEPVVMFSVAPGLNGYTGARRDALHDRLLEALEAVPGVTAVGQSALPLFGNFMFTVPVRSLDGAPLPPNASLVQRPPWISPGFFEALGVPLIAGRGFTAADVAAGGEVAVVNQAFLDRFDLGVDAIGKRMELFGYGARSVEIVGIVGDAKYPSVKDGIGPQVYTPRPARDDAFSSVFFYVRGSGDVGTLLREIPRVVASVDPTLPANSLAPVELNVTNSVGQDRLIALLSAVFAGLATLLAAIGVYAVLSYNIGGRARELGLRLALGSSPEGLRNMVLKQVGRIAAIGAAVGLVAALGVGSLASSLLFGLSGYDPLVFGAALAVIALVVLVASYLPARKASSVAPMEALRYQ